MYCGFAVFVLCFCCGFAVCVVRVFFGALYGAREVVFFVWVLFAAGVFFL